MAEARQSIDAAKTEVLLDLVRQRLLRRPSRILVVGCGTGLEAGILARGLHAETSGIDIGMEFAFDHEAARPATLQIMDAQALEFEDGAFDLVYSFHALEHIPDFRRALSEMSRVLRPGATYCIGTPNKARLLGYLGSSLSVSEKIYWNACDISMRLRGRWSNELGAHAGFYAHELVDYCLACFGDAEEITDQYYLSLYRRRRGLVQWLASTKLKHRILPCVYVAGHKMASVPSHGFPPEVRPTA
jgi:SAM-dependent methyltransferase